MAVERKQYFQGSQSCKVCLYLILYPLLIYDFYRDDITVYWQKKQTFGPNFSANNVTFSTSSRIILEASLRCMWHHSTVPRPNASTSLVTSINASMDSRTPEVHFRNYTWFWLTLPNITNKVKRKLVASTV